MPYSPKFASFAGRLGMGPDALQDLIGLSPKYTIHRLAKKSGGFRLIAKPIHELALVQRNILDTVLKPYLEDVSPYVHGGIRGRSYFTHAKAHRRARSAYVMDLKDAFGQGKPERVAQTLDGLGFDPCWIGCLVALTVDEQLGLPQGASTSNALFNLLCAELDEVMSIFALRNLMRYTRYVDELVLSSRGEITGLMQDRALTIVRQADWKVNPDKIRLFREQNGALDITGLSVHDGHVTLPKKRIEKIRVFLHKALTDRTIYRQMIEGQMSQARLVYGKKLPRRLVRAHEAAVAACYRRRHEAERRCTECPSLT